MELTNALHELRESCERLISAVENDTRVMPYGEAAFVLNKSNRTIFRYIDQGKLHKASGNGVVGVRASDVYMLILKQ